MNIRKAICTTIIIIIIPLAALAESDFKIKFSECFLKYDTMNGETEIVLYNIHTSKKTKMTEEVFKNAFDLSEFEINELMVSEPGSKTTAIKVLAQAKNFMMNTPVQQLFSNMLDTDAKVDLQVTPPNMKIQVIISKQKGMYVAGNNAVRVFENTKEKLILMEFDLSDSPSKPLEVVIGWEEEVTPVEKSDKDYQHDADIFRLRHLKYYGSLIEEYRTKKGKYPLQGESEAQHYVFIAAPHQQKYVQGVPEQFRVTDLEGFRSVLEKGLERKVELRFDPQKVPVSAPNFYIYMVEDDSYFFAVHLYTSSSFTNSLGKHYNKLEITNDEPNRNGLWKYGDLIENKDFQSAINKKPHKEGFFLQLEEQYK